MAEKLDFRKLRYVVVTAETRSLTGAASALSITQPALTRCIAEVEKELGIQIFYRLPRGVTPTEEGERLVNRARVLLADLDMLREDIREGSRELRGRLRVGVVPGSYIPVSAPFLARFAEAHPHADVSAFTGRAHELIPQLNTGELDVVLSTTNFVERWPDIHAEDIAPLQFAYMVRKGHPLEHKESITKSDLEQFPAVMPATTDWGNLDLAVLNKKLGLPKIRPKYVSDDFSVVVALLNSTDAYNPVVTIKSSMVALSRDFKMVTLGNRSLTDHLCLAYSKTRTVSTMVQDLVLIAREVIGE